MSILSSEINNSTIPYTVVYNFFFYAVVWKFVIVDVSYFLAGDTKTLGMLVIEFVCGGFGRDFDFYLGDLRML